jgi:arsenite methyltransferase
VTDLLFKAEIQQMVRTVYRRLDRDRDRGRARTVRPYDDDRLARLPEPAARWAYGTGDPGRHAELQPGETVLDLGCGAGPDLVLAAQDVGTGGRVIGVDLLPEMCRRARDNVAAAGVQADVLLGEVEALPLRDASVDVVLSNGVVSLSARKARLLREARRVLRDHGRVVLADMTLDEEDLPTEVLLHPSAWAG